jgi:hypothetical protein
MAIFYSNSSLGTAMSPKLSRKLYEKQLAMTMKVEMRNLHGQLSCLLIRSLMSQSNGRVERKELSRKYRTTVISA